MKKAKEKKKKPFEECQSGNLLRNKSIGQKYSDRQGKQMFTIKYT